jgi:hypothetical protein
LQSLSLDEQRLFRLYGKLPSKSDHLAKHLKERKYFDSGDYTLQGRKIQFDRHPKPWLSASSSREHPTSLSPGIGIASQGGSGKYSAFFCRRRPWRYG